MSAISTRRIVSRPRKIALTEELVTRPTDRGRRSEGDHPRAHPSSKTLPSVPGDDDLERLGHPSGITYPCVVGRASGLQEGLRAKSWLSVPAGSAKRCFRCFFLET